MKPLHQNIAIFVVGLGVGGLLAYKNLPTKTETKVVDRIVKVKEDSKVIVTTKTDKFDPKTGKIVETTTKNKTKVSETNIDQTEKEISKSVTNQDSWLISIHYFPRNVPPTSISIEDLALSLNYRVFSSVHVGVLGGPRIGVGFNVGISF